MLQWNREWKEQWKYSPPETAAGSGRESRRKPEWKRKRNEDGSEWNRDMRFRLRLDAMNIPMGEAARPAKRSGSVAGGILSGGTSKQVHLLGMSSRCLDPAANHEGAFASCGEAHHTNNIYTLKHNLFTPLRSAVPPPSPPPPSPHPRLCCTTSARIWLLNKLFRKSQLSSANSAHNNNMKLSIASV